MKHINCVFIVVEKGPITKTKDDHTIYQALVADYTGSINTSLWDTIGEQVQPGDIIRLKGGYSTLYKNSLMLYPGKKGSTDRIGDFTLVFSETPNMSNIQWVTDPITKNVIPVFPGQQPPPGAIPLAANLHMPNNPNAMPITPNNFPPNMNMNPNLMQPPPNSPNMNMNPNMMQPPPNSPPLLPPLLPP
eukprot:Phypoly_transcript_21024.p1 GENE.Phypoly_transcript_21024~~Phypoly_transcript_21024.p1  ORF type:complete len:216 (+),score=39.38 Phypoly_transcript_21024:83-649(+)